MKNLFDPHRVNEVKQRIAQLRPDSERQWGKMTPAQVLAHCSRAMETALGDYKPPRMLIGRVIGGTVKRKTLGDDKPLSRNSPTAPFLVVRDQPDFAAERARLNALVDRFAAGGPPSCTAHPHTFFGPMSPDEWAVLMYKHADHHLRQFGA
jgi:hypothetical protein